MSEELVSSLHEFADWLEKANHVHTHSVPRQAAYTITCLEEENKQLKLLLNKKDITLLERLNRYIGYVKLNIYLIKKNGRKPRPHSP